MTSSAFNQLAERYDSEFTATQLGQYYRQRVQHYCQQCWPSGQHLLEINAGTGEDALFLASLGNRVLATDIAQAMVEQIALKAKKLDDPKRIETQVLAIEQLNSLEPQIKQQEQLFDGLLSNFGGLNCIADFEQFVQDAQQLIRPGGYLVLTIMGRWVPWEWGYFLCKGEFRKATRRLSGKTQWRQMDIYYPRLSRIKKQLTPYFTPIHCEGLGIVMPPSYVNDTLKRQPKLFSKLVKLERQLASKPSLAHIADHYLLIYQKRNN